ncbi:MAG: DUF4336 domain-containing protein [Thermosynechococcaceae cyanobacterium]
MRKETRCTKIFAGAIAISSVFHEAAYDTFAVGRLGYWGWGIMTEQTEHQVGSNPRDWRWPFWPIVPLYPYGQRRTLRQEVIPNTLWTFEQLQGILYVVTPIRMTVVKLQTGGLLVYAPVAPTPECVRLVRDLIALHGDVKYIILPTISGLEHKVFVGPFARQFPTAQVYVAPHQWSFPLNLPLTWLGLPCGRTHILPADSAQAPFAEDFDYTVLGPIDLGLGSFAEVAFFHRRSHTLLLTDLLLSIPDHPPAIVQLDPYPLLFHARDNALDEVTDTETNRRKGWQRIVLFSLYFRPSALAIVPFGQALRDAQKGSDRSKKAFWGLYPFCWQSSWASSFAALHHQGRPLVAPILQTLILNRAPQLTLDWVYQVATWDFQRILPCHFEAPIPARAQALRSAFSFLEKPSSRCGSSGESDGLLPDADFALLRELDTELTRRRITPPARETV